MSDYRTYFGGKKVTLMGLGLLGRGLGDAIFLAEHGAELIVTDIRDEKTLAPSLAKLNPAKLCRGAGKITYHLGGHRLEDFRNRDFILKAAGVPLDSPYIAEALKHNVPVEMDASLFAKLVPSKFSPEQLAPSFIEGSRGAKLMPKVALQQSSGQVTIVGVTGTRGKSTVTALIYEILREGFRIYDLGFKNKKKPKIYKGGNLVSEATLPLLKKVRAGDIVVLELDSWQLQGFHDAKLSPHVAVFTTFLDDHLIYYKGDTDRYFEDKIAIFKYQRNSNLLIAGERVAQLIGKLGVPVAGDFIVTKKEDVPSNWNISILGEHNLENIACALKVAEHFKIPLNAVQKAVEGFKAVAGRLEYLRTVNCVKIYNDNSATTPDATIAALRALSPLKKGVLPFSAGGLSQPPQVAPDNNPPRQPPLVRGIGNRNIILIMGGTDKGLDMSKLVAEIPKHCKAVVFLKESGTEKLLSEFPDLKSPLIKGVPESARAGAVTLIKATLTECVEEAMNIATKGDIVLFSPAFASFGKWFKNEYDRGEQFLKIVESL